MKDPTKVIFQYRAEWYTDGRDEPIVAKASRDWVERYILEEEFSKLFGGYVRWRSPEDPTDSMPGEAIGVWSRRTVSHFRRILRERGANYKIENGEGPTQALMMQTVSRNDA